MYVRPRFLNVDFHADEYHCDCPGCISPPSVPTHIEENRLSLLTGQLRKKLNSQGIIPKCCMITLARLEMN